MPGPIHTRLPAPLRIRRIRIRKPSSWWPTIAARQEEASRNIWQALRQHDHLVSGAPQDEHYADRAATFVVCAIRVPMPEERRNALTPLYNLLGEFSFVERRPLDHLYIPIQELGFLVETPSKPDETSTAQLEEFDRHASLPISDFPAFDVEIGGFNSFLDMPFLDVIDDGWCFRVHHRLRDFLITHQSDDFAYLPHIPLGHYSANTDMGAFPARMARWRDRHFGTFTARSVDLLGVSTSDPSAAPVVMHSFELGHERGATDAISTPPTDMY